MRQVLKRAAGILTTLLLLVVPAVIWWQHQNISDWWRLRGYIAPPEIAQLATDTTMTDYGRKLFYVHKPELKDKSNFRSSCTIAEQSIVLGCYIEDQAIYIFDVQDERLAGVEQVTAAHEMLHAAYDRLSGSEKRRIDSLTDEAFSSSGNERLKKLIKEYNDRDPTVVPNELHSIIATEVRLIPQELEEYYSQYFSNRLAIVSYSEKYEQVFNDRKMQEEEYIKQLQSLKQQIEALNIQLQDNEALLSAQFAQLESDRQTAEPNSFNARVAAYNQNVRDFNNQVQHVNRLIDEYNEIFVKYKAVVVEENELFEAINSRPDPLRTE